MNTSDRAEAKLLEIVEAIRLLTPNQRRRLQRRLRISGLLDPEEHVADRDPLRVAPALGAGVKAAASGVASAEESNEVHAVSNGAAPVSSKAPVSEYRSAVRGKTVVDGAASEDNEAAQPAMAALPGQAPEQPIGIIFDGGSRGNPGQGYGSYAIRWPGMSQQVVRLRFGDKVTNNEAEYDTLIAALEATLKRLQDNEAAPETARVDIRGDSALVINQVTGKWECKEPRLQLRCDRVRFLLQRFGGWHLTHHRREKSVETLGH
jgi:ribonuclease HI